MRQHIIDVAKALMTTKGYTGVGLAEILAAAGIPKGSFYHYFRSKEQFGEAILQEYFDEYLVRIQPLLTQGGTGAARLLTYFSYWKDTQACDHPQGKCLVVKLGAEVCDLSEDMRIVLGRGTARIVELIESCIEAGQLDASISNSQDAALMADNLYQMWLGASLLAKINQSEQPFNSALASTRQMLT